MEQEMRHAGEKILTALHDAGHEAYFVGGFVRDFLASRAIKDIDIATSALPSEVVELFPRTLPTGLQHGTVSVKMESHWFEVTTYRKEKDYQQHRRPGEVEFISSLHDDLKRRDFTMNAMAMDLQGNIIDPFGGQADMRSRMIRCVGSPLERFHEDALRMMRCIRFAAEYNFSINELTWNGLLQSVSLFEHIAMERVGSELIRLMEGSYPIVGLKLLDASRLLAHCKETIHWPELKSEETLQQRFANLTMNDEHDAVQLRWPLFFIAAKYAAQDAQHTLRRMRFPVKRIHEIVRIIELHHFLLEDGQRLLSSSETMLWRTSWHNAVIIFGRETAQSWAAVQSSGGLEAALSVYQQEGSAWLHEMSIWSFQQLNVDGYELQQALQRKPGAWIKDILHKLTLGVSVGSIKNEKTELLQQAKLEMEPMQ